MKLQNIIEYAKDRLERIFWPLICLYFIYLLYKLYDYYNGLKYPVNKEFYDHLFKEWALIVCVVLAAAFLFKLTGHKKLASLILAVPAVIFGSILLLSLLIVAFLAILFILFGN
ncbi:MAG: hypothetical protein IPM48_00895 [Saprospiraceae bacterium]|nr:hypothetical protein [Saprospiraceae bacterium]